MFQFFIINFGTSSPLTIYVYLFLCLMVLHLIVDIDEPLTMNRAQQRTFVFLISYIGNLNMKLIRLFLRFVTCSAVRIGKHIAVKFNSLFGLEHLPIAHTCTCSLELPITYSTLNEFTNEFDNMLSNDNVWIMDTI